MRQDIQKHHGVFTKPRIGLALAVVVLAAALMAYFGVTRGRTAQAAASATTTSIAQPQPTSVHIVRIRGNEPNFHIVPLDRTITHTSQVQKLYDLVLTLPPAHLGACAAAPVPEAYVLTFYRNGQSVLTARAGFCPGIDLDRGNPKDALTFRERRATPAFLSELAQVLGLSVSELEPLG
jgi:hypothetical protein